LGWVYQVQTQRQIRCVMSPDLINLGTNLSKHPRLINIKQNTVFLSTHWSDRQNGVVIPGVRWTHNNLWGEGSFYLWKWWSVWKQHVW
jgi:hypothetical protein